MSNTAVGSLYKRVIDAVVEASRTDFEEHGIENATLMSLQDRWQERLSQSHRALFPWDPQPPSGADSTTPTVAASSRSTTTQSATPAAVPPPPAIAQPSTAPVHIKQEPNYDTNFTAGVPRSGPAYAQERAARLVQEQFGTQNLQQQPNGQNVAMSKQESQTPGLSAAQTDGAGDSSEQWTHVLAHRQNQTDGSQRRADNYIRQRVEANMQSLEAGGLLIPLDQRGKRIRLSPKPKSSTPSTRSVQQGLPQLDGSLTDSEDEKPNKDELADDINSDLDDSEDDAVDGGVEDNSSDDVILCLYDKVQRVKNKWKCVLKDGVVTVEGKDYVFHKANGEFEW